MTLRLLLCIALASVVFTSPTLADPIPTAPPELTTIRTRYRSDLQATREPIRTRYIASLDALLKTITKSGDLDAALAVQQDLSAAKGTTATVSGGKVTPELTVLRTRFDADVQTASEGIQTRYIAALETLQESFTKRNNLPAALAVRQELNATKPQGATTGATTALSVSPLGRAPDDVVQPGAVWLTDVPTNGLTSSLTITERQGETFKGRYEWPGMKREFTGTIKDGKLSWLSKDVRTVRGNPGWDNFGTIQGDKIDFVARSADGKTATFSMHKKTSRDK